MRRLRCGAKQAVQISRSLTLLVVSYGRRVEYTSGSASLNDAAACGSSRLADGQLRLLLTSRVRRRRRPPVVAAVGSADGGVGGGDGAGALRLRRGGRRPAARPGGRRAPPGRRLRRSSDGRAVLRHACLPPRHEPYPGAFAWSRRVPALCHVRGRWSRHKVA